MIKETEKPGAPGIAFLLFLLPLLILTVAMIPVAGANLETGPGKAALIIALIFLAFAEFIGLLGFFVVAPNQGVILQLFGRYIGTAKTPGLRWANPFYSTRKISMRRRNFETTHLKVNDHDGNPVEIASVVVWKVIDTAEASFQVDNYENYVKVQSEGALRNLATAYPYDAHQEGQLSLRGSTDVIAEHLKRELHDRLSVAGVETVEARISHLAYAPEIAMAMLQRQQASAIVAARSKIVEGAVGMVEMALAMLSEKNVVQLDDERRASMVSNLLVVLCGERGTQPVVNTGTIYQ